MSTASDNCIIHAEYNSKGPPPYAAEGQESWTRFVTISDTHSRLFPVPVGDVLLHSGDLSAGGSLKKLRITIEWLKTLPHPIKIIIAGNHDFCLDETVASKKELTQAKELVKGKEARDAGLVYLEYEICKITTAAGREWKVYGFPGSPFYSASAFQYSNMEASELCSRIPEDAEILLTHTPPHSILDITRKGKKAGCKTLKRRLDSITECRLHVFGHIHDSYGHKVHPRTAPATYDRVSVNAAMFVDRADEQRRPIIVDLRN